MGLEALVGLTPAERDKIPSAFKLLFPGSEFKDLPPFNPFAAPGLLKFVMWDGPEIAEGVRRALEEEQGYLKRSDFSLDKLSFGIAMIGVEALPENPARFRGWIADVLKEGEQLGGLGFRLESWVNRERAKDYKRLVLDPRIHFDQKLKDEWNSLHETVPVKVIGILGPDGKPRAMVNFTEGPRSNQGKRVRVLSPVQRRSVSAGNPI